MNAMLNIAEAHPYLCWLMAQLRIAFRIKDLRFAIRYFSFHAVCRRIVRRTYS